MRTLFSESQTRLFLMSTAIAIACVRRLSAHHGAAETLCERDRNNFLVSTARLLSSVLSILWQDYIKCRKMSLNSQYALSSFETKCCKKKTLIH
jgi:hypothetical protein